MSLNHVILGLLSREPLTGYEMKKIIQHTPFMYWSGNNNQIYKAFVELLDEGFVTKEVQHQDGSPSKHIYTITNDGLIEFNSWLLSVTDVPVFKKQFLIKLALANQLKRGDLENMLASYADVVKMQAVLSERELDKCYFAEQEPSDGSLFIDLIRENVLSFYSGEHEWVQKVKEFVTALPDEKSIATETVTRKENNQVESTMSYQILENQGKKYLYFTSSGSLIQREQDAIDIVSLCAEHDTNAVVLDGDILSDDFVKLRTGLAGAVLQKLGNYNIKAAVVIKGGQSFPARFQEMVSEHSTGNTFRIFTNLNDAVNWLLV
jgi:DNA-binding PadR family transcriptional regulator